MNEEEDEEQEISAEAINEVTLNAEISLFNAFLTILREEGASEEELRSWQDVFEEYVRVDQKLFIQSGGHSRIEDVKRQIPKNMWIQLMADYFSSDPEKEEPLEITSEERSRLKKLSEDIRLGRNKM